MPKKLLDLALTITAKKPILDGGRGPVSPSKQWNRLKEINYINDTF